jgi:hypothetical protein
MGTFTPTWPASPDCRRGRMRVTGSGSFLAGPGLAGASDKPGEQAGVGTR